ncbi:diguanylate cyclase [Pantanalinema sp. GBBB05]|uniref:diguanylate cyclase n=1 Tax=Pantanalinema sp. GBBB05 TaxID=2604139 RepID=UPI001D7ABC12|nr:diguanylate cyclase [Pantanalinema sp. GBBB05]
MADASSEIQAQLNQLHQEYLQRLAEKVQEVRTCWNQLTKCWDAETANTLHRLIHTLVGSSATFGLTSLSETARTCELLLQQWLPLDVPLALEVQQQIQSLLLVLQQQSEAHTAIPQPSGQTDEMTEPSGLGSLVDVPSPNQRLVWLVEDDPDVARELKLQLSYFGYQVCTFNQPAAVKQACHLLEQAELLIQTAPTAIIMDMTFPEGDLAGAECIAELNQQWIAQYIPIIFTSVRDDLVSRLQAVRAGGDAYFAKPININELIDTLDRLLGYSQPEPYRVLIVEDDQAVAEFHALTLQQAGIVTQVITEPMQIMQPLSEFKPDLILMDIYMPSCSGLELAAVIRQQAAYVSIPIVFLSTETNLNKQLAALSLGGDDFLTKPIQPDHLISSIASRAQRSATLRSLMMRDSLTGLFNHTKIKEYLAIKLKCAKRQNLPLSFAMLDIDHFKLVNDTYGHATGDRVIKSLARLLQQQLRPIDIVGRYGGEEFAVILSNTDRLSAVKVMNRIRQRFLQVQQRANGVEFTVTFSCGVADYPTYQDVAQISYAADQALYQAKRYGRNKVES